VLTTRLAAGQELEPRAYSPSPTGTTFVVVSATRSAGGVFNDPAAPLTDVDAEIGVLTLAAGHSFALFGKSAMVLGAVPVAWGEASGSIGEDRRKASRRGLADPRIKLSMILSGFHPMTPAEFARAPRRPIIGTSITIAPPIGQYNSKLLVNLGSNRWSVKPEVGFSLPFGHWTVDAYAGVVFFTDNDAYYPGSSRRHQDPVLAIQGHVSYTLGRRSWLAFDGTWYAGGKSTVDGTPSTEPYSNTRLGATWAVPVGSRQSWKVSYSAGATTRFGADFKTISAAWQLLIF
jgi:hypothetical protein